MKVNWDKRFLELAQHIANWSKDRSTKVGAVIADSNHRLVSIGYNGFPSGISDEVDSRHNRPAKYMYTEHAERNALYTAARNGTNVEGCTMYLQWFPCADCARGIIQSGIKRLVCTPPNFNLEEWRASFMVAHEMLVEADIELKFVK